MQIGEFVSFIYACIYAGFSFFLPPMKNASLFLVSFLAFSFLFVFRAEASVYQIHLRYDRENDRLFFDESAGVPVQVDEEKQAPNIIEFFDESESGAFSLAFFFDDGVEIARKNFDPSPGDAPFVLETPYFSFAQKMNIYRNGAGDDAILSFDLSRFLTCNRNAICEYEKGENFDTCLPDCVGTVVNFSDETKKLLKQNNNVLTDSKTGEILLRGTQPVATPGVFGGEANGKGRGVALIIGGVAVLLIGLGIFALFRLRRRNRQYGL